MADQKLFSVSGPVATATYSNLFNAHPIEFDPAADLAAAIKRLREEPITIRFYPTEYEPIPPALYERLRDLEDELGIPDAERMTVRR